MRNTNKHRKRLEKSQVPEYCQQVPVLNLLTNLSIFSFIPTYLSLQENLGMHANTPKHVIFKLY